MAENAVGAARDAVCGFFSGECVDGRALKACLESSVTRAATLELLSGSVQPARVSGAAARMIERVDEDGTIEVATLDTTTDSTDGEVKVGLGPGVGGGASSSTQTSDALTRLVRYPGENLEPRLCKRPPG